MKWWASILVGIVNSVVAAFGAGFVGSLCAYWNRVPSFEGESGYFVVGFGLIGGLAGFVVGLVTARVATHRVGSGFFRGLSYAAGVTLILLLLVTGICRATADLPPTIDGKPLVVEFEVRFSQGFPISHEETAPQDSYVFVTADHGSRLQRRGDLRWKEATKLAGQWIVPARVELRTSDPGKTFSVAIGDRTVQYYNLPLAGKPGRADMAWSEWIAGPTFGEVDKIPAEERLAVRYRVQLSSGPS